METQLANKTDEDECLSTIIMLGLQGFCEPTNTHTKWVPHGIHLYKKKKTTKNPHPPPVCVFNMCEPNLYMKHLSSTIPI